MRSPLLVRSREIWREPAPRGGGFADLAVAPLPGFLTAPFGVFCVETDDPVVALTYDDGPHPAHTPGILDVLGQRGATATFFVLAEQVAAHPELARRIVAEGHELALHGWDHTALTTLADEDALRRIRDARARVEDVTGVTVRVFRPPYGKHTWRQALGIRRMGLELMIWSGHAWDWVDAEVETVARRALAEVFPGAVLLLHDHRADPHMLEAGERLPEFVKADVLDRILVGLADRGFTTVGASALLAAHRHVRSALRDRMARE
ncbi:polysaccharide deacetylase family protein [Microbacterium rhizophilus]|uniref:polysaccharide deacetylase family protein n=1 Tax=Microbacterium rhizophilus TaxID=3138934 RepID=UPI0031EABEFB